MSLLGCDFFIDDGDWFICWWIEVKVIGGRIVVEVFLLKDVFECIVQDQIFWCFFVYGVVFVYELEVVGCVQCNIEVVC